MVSYLLFLEVPATTFHLQSSRLVIQENPVLLEEKVFLHSSSFASSKKNLDFYDRAIRNISFKSRTLIQNVLYDSK